MFKIHVSGLDLYHPSSSAQVSGQIAYHSTCLLHVYEHLSYVMGWEVVLRERDLVKGDLVKEGLDETLKIASSEDTRLDVFERGMRSPDCFRAALSVS